MILRPQKRSTNLTLRVGDFYFHCTLYTLIHNIHDYKLPRVEIFKIFHYFHKSIKSWIVHVTEKIDMQSIKYNIRPLGLDEDQEPRHSATIPVLNMIL